MLYEDRDEIETPDDYNHDFTPESNEDFESSISVDGLPYDDDLHVAAFIGKKLLDRNIELEQQLSETARENEEQAREIQLLARQISELRDTERVRSLTYEQWDVARLQVIFVKHPSLKTPKFRVSLKYFSCFVFEDK